MRSPLFITGVLLFVFSSGRAARAQPIAFGAKGGVRATADFTGAPGLASLTSESRPYLIGPTIEIGLPLRLSVEFDALYRRVGFIGVQGGTLVGSTTRDRSNSWEFPLLVKRRFRAGPAHAFAGAGYAPRIVHGSDISSGYYLSGLTEAFYHDQRSEASYPVTHGAVVSGGLDFAIGHVRVSPELRYTHWNAPFVDYSLRGSSATSRQDELFVLLGVAWR